MKKIPVISLVLTIVFCLSISTANAQNISDEAMRYFDRGEAAVGMAKTPADYEDAIKEFEKAAALAPDWPDVYYNLGLIQEKVDKYDDAIRNLTKYLELSPNASDSREVKKFIAKIEYKQEVAAEELNMPVLLEGQWTGGMHYCGGHLNRDIKFYRFKNQLSVEMPLTWNCDLATSQDYSKIAVKIDGKTIRFKFKAKMWIPSLRSESYCQVRFELRMVNSGKLKGFIYQEDADAPYEVVFTKIN